jgi:hypothetical protein
MYSVPSTELPSEPSEKRSISVNLVILTTTIDSEDHVQKRVLPQRPKTSVKDSTKFLGFLGGLLWQSIRCCAESGYFALFGLRTGFITFQMRSKRRKVRGYRASGRHTAEGIWSSSKVKKRLLDCSDFDRYCRRFEKFRAHGFQKSLFVNLTARPSTKL